MFVINIIQNCTDIHFEFDRSGRLIIHWQASPGKCVENKIGETKSCDIPFFIVVLIGFTHDRDIQRKIMRS